MVGPPGHPQRLGLLLPVYPCGRRSYSLGAFMSFHSMGPDGRCAGCATKLLGVHPYLVNWFWDTVVSSTPNAHVSWGYRGQADQNAFMTTGTSELPWPKSAHNHRVAIDPSVSFDPSNEQDPNSRPCARAIDLFQIIEGAGNNGPVTSYSLGFFQSLARVINKQSLPMIWGGNWTTIRDNDHFELTAAVQ